MYRIASPLTQQLVQYQSNYDMSSACSLTMTTGPIEVGRSSRNGDIPGLTSGLALRLGLRLHGPLPQVTRDWPDMQHLALGMTW